MLQPEQSAVTALIATKLWLRPVALSWLVSRGAKDYRWTALKERSLSISITLCLG